MHRGQAADICGIQHQVERAIQVRDLKSYLSGCWRIDRSMLDRRASACGSMSGQARFSPDGSWLTYREWGKLSFGNYEGAAEQRYDLEFSSSTDRALVRFRDGRRFHLLDLSEGITEVTHVCGADFYAGRFVALDHQHWQSAWEVSGPRKDTQIITLYSRQPSEAPPQAL